MQDGTKIEYTYDTSGNLTKVSSNYTSTSYAYDKLNRIVRVVDHNGKATLYEYDENGNRSAVKYANGVVATYTYDSLNRLVKEKIVDKNGNNIAVYEYTLDKKGNRIKAVEDGITTEYEYDKLNRLTKETTSRAVTSYTYDKVGNRLTKTVDDVKTEYTYNSNNQLTKEVSTNSTTVYTYDRNGNLLKQTNGTDTGLFTYDDYNRLISAKVTKDGKTTTDTYTYDIEGNRLTKTTNGTLTKYIVDSNGLSQVLAELDSNNKIVVEYTHGFEIVSQIINKITHYYLFDGNGNVRMLTDSEGAVSDTYDYDAFGTATAEAGLTVNPYRYCGEYQDETTGLYYLRARYYDSTTGRFISADSYSGSTADPVSLHKYLYADANPVMNSDPTGNKTLKEMVGAIAANSIIQRIATSSMVGGLMSMLDTLLGADEVDPLELIESYRNGAVSGIVSGLFTMGITSFGNINCITSIISKLTMGGISAYFSAEGFKGAIESFGEGKYIQGIFRLIDAGMSARSAANEFGGAMKGANAVANGSTCFVAGTLVLTKDGEKPIEDIEVGDYVYSTDPETGESDYKEVMNVFIRQSNIIIHVFVNDEEIETTPTHPFRVENEWVTADKLKAGDVLTLANGTTCAIDRVYAEFTNKAITVYNFEVADFHSYYVTNTGVLVHNANIKSYQTYTKTNPKTGEVYSGRTSGTGTPEENIFNRDRNHHMNDKGFGPAVLDKSSNNYAAIRGREQMLIDLYGGAQSTGGTSGNAINGISINNPKYDYYMKSAQGEFGNVR